MTEVNTDVQLSAGLPETPPKKKEKKGTFTMAQTILLIFLTLLISVGGWFAVGKYYVWTDIDMKRVNAQLDFYKQKVASEPNNIKARVELGYTYFLKKNNTEAIREYNQALVLDPNFYDAYYNLGVVLIAEKRYNEALEKLTKAIQLSPRDYKGHLQRGIAYRNLGMFKEAKESLEQANKLMPTNADIIYEIGRIAEDEGDKELAVQIYKEVLTYDPLFKQASEALERLEKK